MKKSLLIIFLLSIGLIQTVFGQERTIRGKIVDSETKLAIPGVSVFVKGTTVGSVTDAEGNFSLNAPQGATIVVQSLGYTSQEIATGTSATIDINLVADTKQLNEVVVVGYGTQDKRELTSSVAKVSSEIIKDLPVAGIDQALQGRAAGVQISTNSGTPGGGITVRVRGASSIAASNQPLYVIDGIPMITGDFSQLGFGGQATNVLNDLNPSDIQSIEVLKDAASASIYGSRASNGVILITTKRGSATKTQFNFNAYYGFQRVWRTPNFLKRDDYLTIMNEALINDGFLTEQDIIDQGPYNAFVDFYYGGLPFAPETDTDWIDAVLRTGSIQNYELSASGGNDKTKFFVSGSYFDQTGLVINSRFQRFSTRLNLDHKVSDKLSFGTSIQLSRAVNNRIVSDNTLFGPFANALASSPLFPIYDANGLYTRPNNFYSNPVAEGTENDDIGVSLRAIANIFANYKIIDGLVLTTKAAVDLNDYSERRYTPNNYPGSSSTNQRGSGVKTNSNALKWVLEATLNYTFDINKDHEFSVLAGINRESNIINTTSVSGIVFPGEKFRYVSNAATILTAGSGNAETYYGLSSYFGRINYAYKSKYLLNLNLRADGSSRFGGNNQWGMFPAASVGWRLSEESFFEGFKKTVNEFKIRASYGTTGNQEFGNFASRYLYSGGTYLDQAGILQTQIPNPDLKWESTTQTDIGIDVSLFNSRINLSADYYNKLTNDLLFNRPIATQNGFGAFATNIGSVENKGFEFTLNTVNLDGKDGGFRWTTDLNLSFNRNKVVSLYQDEDVFYGFGGNSLILREGQPIGTFFGFIADGVFSRTADVPDARRALGIQAGDMNYRDINGDNIITDDDRTIIGNAQPKFTGGFTNNFSFKGFDLNVFLQFSYGNKTWNAAGNFQQGMLANFFEDNQTSAVLRRWRQEGDVTDVPRATTAVEINQNNESSTTRFVEDGSFLRVKNVILGYNLPASVLKYAKLRSVRVYVQAQNLFTFTNYSGFDPEVNFAGTSNITLGTDFYTFPQPRTFTFGINVGF
ncbi:MAG: TonB-dependent receptor [Microscillaceae bacterium]|nr:TonB-dependent receptor [Microscillaceae bacterium]